MKRSSLPVAASAVVPLGIAPLDASAQTLANPVAVEPGANGSYPFSRTRWSGGEEAT